MQSNAKKFVIITFPYTTHAPLILKQLHSLSLSLSLSLSHTHTHTYITQKSIPPMPTWATRGEVALRIGWTDEGVAATSPVLCVLSRRSWGANICTGREMEAAERGDSEMWWWEAGSILRDGERCIAIILMGPSTLIVGLEDNFRGGGVQFFFLAWGSK